MRSEVSKDAGRAAGAGQTQSTWQMCFVGPEQNNAKYGLYYTRSWAADGDNRGKTITQKCTQEGSQPDIQS